MSYKEAESMYYEFTLNEDFISDEFVSKIKNWDNDLTPNEWVTNHLMKNLRTFVDRSIHRVTNFKGNTISIITNDIEKLNEVKQFCKYLYENNHLLQIAQNTFINEPIDESNQKVLNTFGVLYKVWKLDQSLGTKENVVQKRLKM
jgi:hypothetical protein